MNLARSIRVRRNNEDHHTTMIDSLDYGCAVFLTGAYVAGGNPTPDAGSLKHSACSVGRGFVLARIADECVESHCVLKRVKSRGPHQSEAVA
jgi:hypothetical protein